LHHGEAQGVRVDAVVALLVEPALRDDIGMDVQELQHESIVDDVLLVQAIDESVVPESRPPFIHHLSLGLRIEVLRQLADDADQLSLPRSKPWRGFLYKVEDVLFRLFGKDRGRCGRYGRRWCRLWQC